MEITNI